MAQSDITIYWDREKKRAVTDPWRPVPVSVRKLFLGVAIGDTVTTRLVVCRVVAGRIRSEPVAGAPPTANLNFYRVGAPVPTALAFSDGTNTTVEKVSWDEQELGRQVNALPLVQAAGGVSVKQIGRDTFDVTANKQGVVGYTLTAVSDRASVFELAAGAPGSQQADTVVFRAQPVYKANLTSAFGAPSVDLELTEVGTVNKSQIETVELTGDFECGSFRLLNATGVTVPIAFDAAAGEVESALNDIIGADAVRVLAEGRGQWRIEYQAVGVQTPLTGDAEGITATTGQEGTLDLSSGGPGGEFLIECTTGNSDIETLFTAPLQLRGAG